MFLLPLAGSFDQRPLERVAVLGLVALRKHEEHGVADAARVDGDAAFVEVVDLGFDALDLVIELLGQPPLVAGALHDSGPTIVEDVDGGAILPDVPDLSPVGEATVRSTATDVDHGRATDELLPVNLRVHGFPLVVVR